MVVRAANHGIEVYMARRAAQSAFLPDAYVFPGGAVETSDASERAMKKLDRVPEGVEAAIVVAALRELFEEAGMLFAHTSQGEVPAQRDVALARQALSIGTAFLELTERYGWTLAGSALTYYSRWITPSIGLARRFDTRFFLAQARDDQGAAADAVEMHDALWTSPAEALARGQRGEWHLVYPTLRHLERLSAFSSIDELYAHAQKRRPRAVMPRVTADGGIELPTDMQTW